jgi:hypothetical protein
MGGAKFRGVMGMLNVDPPNIGSLLLAIFSAENSDVIFCS